MDKSNFKFNNENLEEFRSVITNLCKISNTIKMKMTSDNLLLYSIDTAGENSNVSQATALAVKSYSFPSQHFMKIKHYDDDDDDDEEDQTKGNIDWIIRNGTILNKKINFFTKDVDIKGVFNLRKVNGNSDVKYTRNVIMSDDKFKFSITGDEPHVIRDMSLDQLNTILDPVLSDISFSIPTKEFENARSASNIEPEDIITIHITNGKIYFKQSSWELLVGKIDYDGNKKISFHKKYLKSINPKVDEIHFSVFQTFLLYKEANQKLMISYEQNF
tara:strand:+ start:8480 stop:9301 length:822 start_codon:yes stop_codon:yes gene_type:complete